MAVGAVAAACALALYSCGSGTDEISITCTNAGSGKQVCGATSGADVEGGESTVVIEPAPTPRR